VVGGGDTGLAGGEQVDHERLQVGLAGVQQAEPSGGKEAFGLADGVQVGVDRGAGTVLGAQVPLEGAGEAERIVPGWHGPTVADPKLD
jgi:hypothetical protein